jgi:hypothetical protein
MTTPNADKQEDQLGEKETTARADAALKRMLATPHKPHKPIGKGKRGIKPMKSANLKRHGNKPSKSQRTRQGEAASGPSENQPKQGPLSGASKGRQKC